RCGLSSVRAVVAGVGSSSRALDAACGAADAASSGQIFSNFGRQTKNAASAASTYTHRYTGPASPGPRYTGSFRSQTCNFSKPKREPDNVLTRRDPTCDRTPHARQALVGHRVGQILRGEIAVAEQAGE